MDDFIDKVAWGLNASSATASAIRGRASLRSTAPGDELAFKDYLRIHQVPTLVWYSAYGDLTRRTSTTTRRSAPGCGSRERRRGSSAGCRAVSASASASSSTTSRVSSRAGYGGLTAAPSCCSAIEDAAARRAPGSEPSRADVTAPTSGRPARRRQRRVHGSGLAQLGLPPDVLGLFSNEFLAGMTTPHRRRILGDVGDDAPERWDWGGPAVPPSTPLLLLYAATTTQLARHERRTRGRCRPACGVLTRLGTSDLDGFEPFGFRDGISQPFVEGLSKAGPPARRFASGEFALGYPNEYGRYTDRPLLDRTPDPRRVLPRRPAGLRPRRSRAQRHLPRLAAARQDVRAFWRFADAATRRRRRSPTRRGGSGSRRRWSAAGRAARRSSSRPSEDDPALAEANDFGYFTRRTARG